MRVQLNEELWSEIFEYNRANSIGESYHLNNIYMYAHYDDDKKVFEFCIPTEAPLKAECSNLNYFDSVKFCLYVEEEDGLREIHNEKLNAKEIHVDCECKSC